MMISRVCLEIVRRQMITAIDGLEVNSRPPKSKILEIKDEPREIRRLRLGKWRIVYAIIEEKTIILGVRRRPPYDYQDIQRMLKDVE